MKLRIVLLAGIVALAGAPLRAEEFQFTLRGTTDCFFGTTCNPAMTGPTTITFDVNTLEGMASYNPGPYPPPPPDPIVLEGSVPITNYLATVNGHTVGFAAHGGDFSFGCFGPVLPNHYECSGGFGQVSYDDNELWIQTVTEAEFNSFKDPLASIFLLNPNSFCGGVSSICSFDQPSGTTQLFGPWTITPVPTPVPLSLFLAGVVGLALSRRRRRLDPLSSPS
jgi:MYXO-CTERM domain-containing protein